VPEIKLVVVDDAHSLYTDKEKMKSVTGKYESDPKPHGLLLSDISQSGGDNIEYPELE